MLKIANAPPVTKKSASCHHGSMRLSICFEVLPPVSGIRPPIGKKYELSMAQRYTHPIQRTKILISIFVNFILIFVKSQPVRSNGSWSPWWVPGTPGRQNALLEHPGASWRVSWRSRTGAGHIGDRGGLAGQSESAPTDNAADAPSVIELLASYFGR